jgi:hypothetical protein
MATTIILYDQLTSADTGGTWSYVGTTTPFPPAPNTYNGSIDFAGYSPGLYVYRYTKTTSGVTATADVAITWQGSSPARINDTCTTAFEIPGTLVKPFTIVVQDDNRSICPNLKAPSLPSPADYPAQWNQGTYSGDLWYKLYLPAKFYNYMLEITVDSSTYSLTTAAQGVALQVYKNTLSANCVDDELFGSITASKTNKSCTLKVPICADLATLVRFRIASITPGNYNITTKVICDMATVISTEYFDCDVSSIPVYRKVQTVQDVNGTGILTWTLDNGDLPDNIIGYFEVYANGKRLDYPDEFTVQEFVTPVTSRITILNPVAGTYYTMIKYS